MTESLVIRRLDILRRLFRLVGVVGIPVSFITPVALVQTVFADSPPTPTRIILYAFAALALVGSLAICAVLLVVARMISVRRARTFCIVVSAILCVCFPIGTALGVFGLILLNKPEVRVLFAAA